MIGTDIYNFMQTLGTRISGRALILENRFEALFSTS